jgi:hypothetical protein
MADPGDPGSHLGVLPASSKVFPRLHFGERSDIFACRLYNEPMYDAPASTSDPTKSPSALAFKDRLSLLWSASPI